MRTNAARKNNGRSFNMAQVAYMGAKAMHEVRVEESRKYSDLMDEEGARLGLEVPYAILPEGHPMWAKAQELLNKENEAKTIMYAAAHNLFDWAVETTLARCGTEQQKADVRGMVAKVKTMAYVEQPFEQLVKMCMSLEVR